MSAIRNSCVGRGVVSPAGGVVAYTVPTDFVFLLKSILFTYQSASPTSYLAIVNSADHSTVVFAAQGTLGPPVQVMWEGWMALNAGDYIQINSSVAGLNYWISGATLPFTP